MKKMKFVGQAVMFSLMLAAFAAATFAQTVIVTPTNTQGWSTADTRPGGDVDFVSDAPPAGGNGSLELTTDGSVNPQGAGTAKAQYMHGANLPLSQVTELSYMTKQVSASFAGGAPSYQLPVCLGGIGTPTPTNPSGCIGFTTFVYEPYQNGTVTPNAWQTWDVDSGQFWSSRGYNDGGTCVIGAGGGGAPFYNLTTLKTICPTAIVVGFGVNIGSNNPNYVVRTDFVNFNGTTYNFEMFESPTTAGQCKNSGWQTLRRADGSPFRNQGDCIQYVNTGN
jgi:hypothetical protein